MKVGIKLPDNNKIGLKFVKGLIKTVSNKKLYGIFGVVEKYEDNPEKQEIIIALKEEFKKRGLECEIKES